VESLKEGVKKAAKIKAVSKNYIYGRLRTKKTEAAATGKNGTMPHIVR
jgi:hypothetical protein